MENDLAPIVVFAYDREDHLEKTLNALASNPTAKQSHLFIFSDGPKDGKPVDGVLSVRKYIAEDFDNSLFMNVKVFEAKTNKGLAQSIIDGVTKVINEYSKVIVVEDDSVVSNDFLEYMNNALNYYKNEKVWSIGGFSLPIMVIADYRYDVFATVRCSSCCWATWEDRWEKIDWEVLDYNKFRFNFIKRRSFNRFGSDMASMLDDQMNGRISSWAIRFDYNMWKNDMINILPIRTRVMNIGFDGSGTHCKTTNEVTPFSTQIEILSKPIQLSLVKVEEDIRKKYRKPFHVSKLNLFTRFLGNIKISWRRNNVY